MTFTLPRCFDVWWARGWCFESGAVSVELGWSGGCNVRWNGATDIPPWHSWWRYLCCSNISTSGECCPIVSRHFWYQVSIFLIDAWWSQGKHCGRQRCAGAGCIFAFRPGNLLSRSCTSPEVRALVVMPLRFGMQLGVGLGVDKARLKPEGVRLNFQVYRIWQVFTRAKTSGL